MPGPSACDAATSRRPRWPARPQDQEGRNPVRRRGGSGPDRTLPGAMRTISAGRETENSTPRRTAVSGQEDGAVRADRPALLGSQTLARVLDRTGPPEQSAAGQVNQVAQVGRPSRYRFEHPVRSCRTKYTSVRMKTMSWAGSVEQRLGDRHRKQAPEQAVRVRQPHDEQEHPGEADVERYPGQVDGNPAPPRSAPNAADVGLRDEKKPQPSAESDPRRSPGCPRCGEMRELMQQDEGPSDGRIYSQDQP